ncbi:hypothetical protein HQN59_05760 [Schlegelella sp. ID0723]|uniref:Uncharacterized protein n=1 Tax=Piscinibacter koreensis TaxID=2742824 RepID=A0A7Y6NLD2_9BURK|nr:hypothetical protein [Schlegelella koreensis]NUZ05265.1 hypothetical protein [Schlegelella koreensis]
MALAAALAAAPARAADPGYYVVTVYDDPGVRNLDLRYWSVKPKDGHAVLWPEIGLGLNTGRWYTFVLASWITGRDTPTELSTLSWQNDYLLTQGQWPIDVAVHTLLAVPRDGAGPKTIEIGPALQTDVGRTQLNANVFLERSFGSQSEHPARLKYQWQVRHRWRPWLHVGAQGFGESGRWSDWEPDTPSHRAGPALFGTLPFTDRKLTWQAAWLHGKTYGQRGSMFTAYLRTAF